jgi:hypothetical protein
MNPKIYLAKPYDRTEDFDRKEFKFLDTMNIPTPEVVVLSTKHNLNRAYERIPEGMPQYFYYNGVDMEYIYPVKDTIISFEGVDLSIPILQPFTYTRFEEALLLFDKIIFVDDDTAEKFIKNNNLQNFKGKFHTLKKREEPAQFMEYSISDTKNVVPYNVKYYNLANKLVNAIKNNILSDLEYKSL